MMRRHLNRRNDDEPDEPVSPAVRPPLDEWYSPVERALFGVNVDAKFTRKVDCDKFPERE